MKERFGAIRNGLPHPIRDYAQTMLVGAGIGALTAGTAKIFQKLNVPHPADPKNWSQDHRNRQSDHRGGGHGRG